MKSMLLAIRLKYFYLTYKGIKTVEVRKICPKNFVGDVYEYVSKTNFEKELQEIPENEREFFKQFKGKVGLKFTVRKVDKIRGFITLLGLSGFAESELTLEDIIKKSCLTTEEFSNYLLSNDGYGYAYHIEDLVIFDKPKELSEFKRASCKGCFAENTNYCDEKYCRITKAPQNFVFVESEE